MDRSRSKSSQPAMPSSRAATDDELTVLEVPNQREMDAVAKLFLREQNRTNSSDTVPQREALFKRLEDLHDNPDNEKAVLFNKLHEPLEAFLQLSYSKEDRVFCNLRARASKLLSVWRRSLSRRENTVRTPAARRFVSPASTPVGSLWLPRNISESPERDESDYTPMDLDTDRDGRNSTKLSHRLTPTEENKIDTRTNELSESLVKEESVECGLCSAKISSSLSSIQQHIKSDHRAVMGKKSEVPKNLMEYCDEHDIWFVHKNRKRHYNVYPHLYSEKLLPSEAFVFDPATLSRQRRKRPIGRKSKLYGRDLKYARRTSPGSGDLDEFNDAAEDAVHEPGPGLLLDQSMLQPTSLDIAGTPVGIPATTVGDNDVSPVGYKRRKASNDVCDKILKSTVPSTSVKSFESFQERDTSPLTTVVNKSREENSDPVSGQRTRQRSTLRSFKTVLKECITREEVQRLVAERVKLLADDTEIFNAQSKSSISVRESHIKSIVHERLGDDDYVADWCEMPEHNKRIMYLEAKCELLTQRNVALEGERARFRSLAERAMYGEAGDAWNERQQALDQLVREHLGWNMSAGEGG